MKLTLWVVFFPLFLVSQNRDSLANLHYKIRFSIQGKYTATQFDCYMRYEVQDSYKTHNSSQYSVFNGKINSEHTFNPELKIDFELPLWLKLTCGVNYNSTKFNIQSDQVFYLEQYIYDPNSTPGSGSSPDVIGSVITYDTLGYNKDAIEISGFNTFTGLGLSKQYKRFNFDIDYCFSINRITNGFAVRKIYDNNNTLEKTEAYNFMSNNLSFAHNFSTSISYRFYKNISFKLGFQYSKNDRDVVNSSYQHYTQFKRAKYQSVFAGFAVSFL